MADVKSLEHQTLKVLCETILILKAKFVYKHMKLKTVILYVCVFNIMHAYPLPSRFGIGIL